MSASIQLNPAFPSALWRAFGDDLSGQAAVIFDETDPDALRRHCHKLGGAAGMYGVVALREAAVALNHSPDPLTDAPARAALREAIDATLAAVDAHTA